MNRNPLGRLMDGSKGDARADFVLSNVLHAEDFAEIV
jgi:hypothetical protein